MPIGVECYRDGSATPYFGTTLPAGLILGGVDLTDGNNSGSITDANLLNGTPFWFLNGGGSQDQPTITISGDTITWAANADGAHYVGRLMYGIR